MTQTTSLGSIRAPCGLAFPVSATAEWSADVYLGGGSPGLIRWMSGRAGRRRGERGLDELGFCEVTDWAGSTVGPSVQWGEESPRKVLEPTPVFGDGIFWWSV